jgi:transposase
MRRITRSYRIRTYPNGAQRRLRDRWFGADRWLWNTALEIRTPAYLEKRAMHSSLSGTGEIALAAQSRKKV